MQSAKVGVAKPNPIIYEQTLSKLHCAGEETIFLDDIGQNLKPASKMGITTIKVLIGLSGWG